MVVDISEVAYQNGSDDKRLRIYRPIDLAAVVVLVNWGFSECN
jgi:hypothetical protein